MRHKRFKVKLRRKLQRRDTLDQNHCLFEFITRLINLLPESELDTLWGEFEDYINTLNTPPYLGERKKRW
jgi:hypothetical protein